jgi:hypothetical protein
MSADHRFRRCIMSRGQWQRCSHAELLSTKNEILRKGGRSKILKGIFCSRCLMKEEKWHGTPVSSPMYVELQYCIKF